MKIVRKVVLNRSHRYFIILFVFRSTKTWHLNETDEKQGWRHFRLQQSGRTASKQTHYLSVSGFEIYGTINGPSEDRPGSSYRKLRKQLKAQVGRLGCLIFIEIQENYD